MKFADALTDAVNSLPGELRPIVSRWFDVVVERHGQPDLPDGCLAILVKAVACSEFAANVLLRDWPELADRLSGLDARPDFDELGRFCEQLGSGDAAVDETKAALRKRRNQLLLQVLWRELAGIADVYETLEDLSDIADHLLRAAGDYAQEKMHERFGRLRDEHGDVVPMVILGMGKLGGRELNFSSDVDLIFAYPSNGESDGRKALPAQPYFDRLSQNVIALIGELTADGFVYRTDTRLRPFGESGPPVVSFAALESYLLQHGRDWERYAYVKARVVWPQPPAAVAKELNDTLISPFVYRRYLDYGVFESLREMHAMVAAEVQRRELQDNVKLGPGGIREIEFIVQSLQLVRGGSRADLRTPSLRQVLPLLADGRSIDAATAKELNDAYCFLRRAENFIQAMYDKQTHDLPNDPVDRARLCLAMGVDDWGALLELLDQHRARVTRQFEQIAFRGRKESGDASIEQRYAELWEAAAGFERWQQELATAGFSRAADVAEEIVQFQASPNTRKADAAASERLQVFVPRLLNLAGQRDDPALAVRRCLAVVERILRRSAYIALLNENRLAAERLVGLCERSAYISEQLARFPVLLDELLDPRLSTASISKQQLSDEIDERLEDCEPGDSESQMELLAQFQRATMFRIAVADFGGDMQIMKVSDCLTYLAETVLEHALAAAWRDLTHRHGVPRYRVDDDEREAGFAIIAYGKLGGLELSYGSDLDIVFLHDSTGTGQMTDGDKSLDNPIFFLRLVRRLVHFLTTQTSTGVLYEIDTRLRPSGRKGLLVTSTDAFERYQEENAWTWEHQALLRARPVAGSARIRSEFERIRSETLTSRVRKESLRDDVISMRMRMRDELDRGDREAFDLKQGRGGIGDIEFLVQFLVLASAADNPSVVEFSDNVRQLNALAECGAISLDSAARLQQIYRRYRRRAHHLALNGQPPLIPADDFIDERRVVTEAWEQHVQS